MKIEELTTKIYEEGVAKAKKQEEELLAQARTEADRIVSEARQKATDIVESARRDAEQSKSRLASEMKLAGDQAVAQLEARITDCLVDATLPAAVKSSLDDKEFLQQLVRDIVARWNTGETNVDISVVLPAAGRKELADYFAAKAKDLLDRGLQVNFSDEVKNGFQIKPSDGSYRISFREEDFVAFFRGFLRDRTREILFPSSGAEEQTQDGAGPGR